jgi:hydroxyacylglutathione hydrolase
MSTPVVTMTLRELDLERALADVEAGAALVDLRPVPEYLDVHLPGSLDLVFERGPGFAQRARDCIPLDVPLVLLDLGHGDPEAAAEALQGKGFTVMGKVVDAINAYAESQGTPASTDVVTDLPAGAVVLDVGDPGALSPEAAVRIPVDRLWIRASEIEGPVVAVAAGWGVRAALAVGILERAGLEPVFLDTRR